jgi:hypothetical protein
VVGLLLLVTVVLAGCDSLNPATPLPPTATPEPPSTVALGTFDCVDVPGSPAEPQLQTCWRGTFNGAYVTVGAGHAGLAADGQVQDSKGLIVVADGPDLWADPATRKVYETPQAVGSVRIRGAAGYRLTLATADPNVTFVFDLQTRQWVTP